MFHAIAAHSCSTAGLPRAASWANKGTNGTPLHVNATVSNQPAARTARRPVPATTVTKQQRSGSSTVSPSPAIDLRAAGKDRKTATTATIKTASRPTTPANVPHRPTTPATTRSTKQKETVPPVPSAPPRSPTSSVAVESEASSSPPDGGVVLSPDVVPAVPAALPSVPAIPPGLSAPPGLPPPTRSNSEFATSPPPGLQLSQSSSSYQMSTQAQALMEDLRARRESSLTSTAQSPFPDLDRMLQTLSENDGGFSFNLDPKLAGSAQDASITLPDLSDPTIGFGGSFFDSFPGLRPGSVHPPHLIPPPGISYPPSPHRSLYDPLTRSPAVDRQSTASPSYTGSFNPFAEATEETPSRRFSPLDEERKVSRFGFARGRNGSTSSPHHTSSPLSNSESVSQLQYFGSSELASPMTQSPGQWPFHLRHQQSHDFPHTTSTSAMSSPLVSHALAHAHSLSQSPYAQQQQPQSRFMPFDSDVSEAQLREFIHASRDRATPSRNGPPGRTLLFV